MNITMPMAAILASIGLAACGESSSPTESVAIGKSDLVRIDPPTETSKVGGDDEMRTVASDRGASSSLKRVQSLLGSANIESSMECGLGDCWIQVHQANLAAAMRVLRADEGIRSILVDSDSPDIIVEEPGHWEKGVFVPGAEVRVKEASKK